MTELEEALEVLADELKGNQESCSYYETLKSNLACFLMDNLYLKPEKANELAVKQINSFIYK